MESTGIQVAFFQHIKTLLPPHKSMVDEVADLLNISNDSAYRRIRGEKPISLEEIKKLADEFKISLDQFMRIETDSYIFSGKMASSNDFLLEEWLASVHQNLCFMNTFKNRHMYYYTKDLPFIAHFQIPELAAFKNFFWKKSILQYNELRGVKFSFDIMSDDTYHLGLKVIQEYNKIPSTEIWNIESINSTIRQIEFYREAKMFESTADVVLIYEKVEEFINHHEKQAEYGKKFMIGQEPNENSAEYHLFNNELILGDNSFLLVTDTMKICFLNHSVINFIGTRDERFCNYRLSSIQNLIKKSTQISEVGEKERTRFFNKLRDKIKLASRL